MAAVAGLLATVGGLAYIEKNYKLSNGIQLLRNATRNGVLQIVRGGTNLTVADAWEYTLQRVSHDKIGLINAETGETFTFAQIEAYSNQIANWAIQTAKMKPRDVCALFMENRPEFIMMWLGLTKAGVVIALINSNNKKRTLLHALETGKCTSMIYGAELENAVRDVANDIANMPLYVSGSDNSNNVAHVSLDTILLNASSKKIGPAARAGIKSNDNFGFIYTSGTTGLPKACVIPHAKFMMAGRGSATIFGVTPDDVLYTCLPLYHSAGGMLGAGIFLMGCTMIVSRKFSASRYFEHCTKYNATCTQYIGELARYLLNSKPSKYDQAHNVRIAIGNGMRAEAWIPYQTRFRIPEIGEFYGATEGNKSFVNHTKTKDFINFPGAGACGYMSPLMAAVQGEVTIIEHDPVTEMPVRDPKTGLCIKCPLNKPGELVGLIPANQTFKAYTDTAATEKKVLKDVLKKGDQYFRTGDLLRVDEDGYIWFVDRVGDTFRWKGENVSTGEVAACISDIPKITEANVYGVKIPGSEDGRACMVAITTEDGSKPDFNTFLNYVDDNLATYQRPIFVRLLPAMQSTGTFKQRKVDFVKDGFDPKVINDRLWWYNPEVKSYEELDNNAYGVIIHGKARL